MYWEGLKNSQQTFPVILLKTGQSLEELSLDAIEKVANKSHMLNDSELDDLAE
jgi:hypothetical protein